ncbi:MAG: hypothetical protein Q4F21_01925 [Lachnospiraceae bacterium]|nr:hypothetical protein [Lachnospiraceae bacterium]
MNMKKGILYGVLSGVSWAVNALLLYNVLNLYAAAKGDTGSFKGWMLILTCALVIALVDSALAFISELLILAKMKKLGEFWKTLLSRDSIAVLPAAICSGVFGAVPYVIASNYNSPLALTLSTAFPAIGAITAVIWFKEKLTKIKFAGILVTIIGVGAMTGLGETVPWFVYLIALIPAFGYAFEGLFGYNAMRGDIHPEVTTVMRRVYFILLFSIMILICSAITGDFGYIGELLSSFEVNAEVFPFLTGLVGNKAAIWVIFFIGSACSAISYAVWYFSMIYGGVGTAQALNITYSAFLVVFMAIPPFKVIPGIGTIIGVLIILAGAVIVSYESIRADRENAN